MGLENARKFLGLCELILQKTVDFLHFYPPVLLRVQIHAIQSPFIEADIRIRTFDGESQCDISVTGMVDTLF